jgi:hypothetical protein
MDRLDLIRAYNNLADGNALVILTDAGPIELIISQDDSTASDLETMREVISILLEEDILYSEIMPVGTKYIRHGDSIIPVTKVYEVDSEEHLAEDNVKNMPASETFKELLARKYVAKYEGIVDLKVHWDTKPGIFVIQDLDDNDILYKSFKEMHTALYKLL